MNFLLKIFFDKKMRWFAVISAVWMAVLLLPYAVIGETWGMVWYLMTLPISEWFKETWESMGVTFYVGLVTVVHGLIVFTLLNGLSGLFNSMKITGPTKPTDASVEASYGNDDDDFPHGTAAT